MGKTNRAGVENSNIESPVPFTEETTPDWLRDCLSQGDPHAQLPGWCLMDALPNIKVDDHILNRDQVVSLLSILQKLGPRLHWKATDYLKPPQEPIWTELRQKFDPEQVNEFLLAVFEMWDQNASLRKDFWAILTLGIWGNDFTARKLAILTGSWLRRSGTKRSVNDFIPKSVAALMVLGLIGTPTAISFIRNWATRQKPGGLFQFVDLAQSLSKYLARQKRVSLFELDLQNVPDCGFDQEGGRDFDFGSRQFRVTSNEAFEPLIFNGSSEELKVSRLRTRKKTLNWPTGPFANGNWSGHN